MLRFNPFMQENLAQYVSRILRDKGLSESDVERQSRKTISQSQVNRIKNGQVTSPGPSILRALARGLQQPNLEVFAVAYGLSLEQTPIESEIVAYVRELPPARRSDLLRMAKMFYAENDRLGGIPVAPRSKSPGIPLIRNGSEESTRKRRNEGETPHTTKKKRRVA